MRKDKQTNREIDIKKKKESYANVINHIRTRLRFALLRSILVAVRGYRGNSTNNINNLNELAFNLIPQERCYEVLSDQSN